MSSNADRQRSSIANRAVTLPKLRTQFSSYSDPSWKSLWRRIAIAFFAPIHAVDLNVRYSMWHFRLEPRQMP